VAQESDVVFADLIDADPPPRELTPTARRYIAAQATLAWLVLLLVFVVVPAAIAVAAVPTQQTIIWLASSVAGAFAVGWWTSTKRAKVRKVIVHGVQQPARIANVAHLVVRRGLMTARRVTMIVEVQGRRAKCVSWSGDLEDAEGGAWIRVLVLPDVDFVVPVVSVT
jgi:hypothetical protein